MVLQILIDVVNFSTFIFFKFRQYKNVNIANFVYYGENSTGVTDRNGFTSTTRENSTGVTDRNGFTSTTLFKYQSILVFCSNTYKIKV